MRPGVGLLAEDERQPLAGFEHRVERPGAIGAAANRNIGIDNLQTVAQMAGGDRA